MAPLPHVLLGIGAATLAGAIWAGIAGFLKAAVGAHEVITTIMLNWIAIWAGDILLRSGGPLQSVSDRRADLGRRRRRREVAGLLGVQQLQGLHVGFFVALAALVVFYLLLNRTTLGYEVRAVGFNPDAAAYGGINVKKNLIRAMAISGAFAGLAAASTCSATCTTTASPTSPCRRSASSASPSRCSGATPRSASVSRALLFGALLFGTTHGPRAECDSARPRRQPHAT